MDITQIIVAILGLVGVIISVLVTAKSTQNKMTSELQTQNAVQNQKIDQLAADIQAVKGELTNKMDSNDALKDEKIQRITDNIEILKEDVKEHNHYAKLFAETMPVVQERQTVANKRIGDLESEMKELRVSK